ncbi:hypothetical protein [Antrihabitans cavernicola]|uniref:Fe-S oxidoreductase n=1 Tax=Antrihabitans cavernicola TaxID=2495913 RepID=A0A5A7SI99_9NOCA|nr:hypothetical protein [Spelaeibacter cavernicola]KAA0023961.1 hypothetical protein FOY51_05115 [Spelaeibacter cavernicola]
MSRGARKDSGSRLRRASRGSNQSAVITVIALGYAKLWRARIGFDDRYEIYVCSGMRGGFGRAGTTIGGAYLTDTNTALRTIRHESVHADQWARYGASFAIRYLLEERRHPKAGNKFEIEAGLVDGGYTKSSDPRV